MDQSDISTIAQTDLSSQNISSLSKHSKTDSLIISPFNSDDLIKKSKNDYKTSLDALPVISLNLNNKTQLIKEFKKKKEEFVTNDWSKTNCSLFLTPIEDFLETQRKREKISRKKCNRKLKAKLVETIENEREQKIKDFDDKIHISILLKKLSENKSTMSSVASSSSSSQSVCSNYRILLAQDRKHDNCERCQLRNRKQEQIFLNKIAETPSLSTSPIEKKRPRFLPSLESDYSKKLLKKIYFRKSINKDSDLMLSDPDKYELMSNKLLKKIRTQRFSFDSNEEMPFNQIGRNFSTNSLCICPSTQFWTGSVCTNKYVNGTSCSATFQCQDYNGLSCTSSVCQCSSVNYWTGSVCTAKLGNWGSCTQSYQCQHWLGLTCRWTRCTCPMHQYWTSSGCQNLPTPPWYYNSGSNLYYSVQLTPTDYYSAQAWCNAYSGNLFTIQTSPDLTLLQTIYSNQIGRNFYVGGYAAVGFDFRWLSTNVPIPSQYWCPGEPNCGQPCEPCTLAGWSSAFQFNDISCSYTAPFFCERR